MSFSEAFNEAYCVFSLADDGGESVPARGAGMDNTPSFCVFACLDE